MRPSLKPWRKIKKWDMPISHSPHVEKYRNRELYTLFKVGSTCEVGDLISLFLDAEKPYDYNNKTEYFEITSVYDVVLEPDRFRILNGSGFHDYLGYLWKECDGLAQMLGLEPPTGIELGRMLNEKYDIPEDGIKAQVIGWKKEEKS